MAIGFGRQKLLVNTGSIISFGSPVSLYASETSVSIASAGNWTVPVGAVYITGDGTAAQLQYTPNSTTTYRQFAPTGYCGIVESDGQAWRVHNSATTGITIWYFNLN